MKLKEMLDDVKMHEIDDDMRDLGLGGPDAADDDNAGLDPDFKQTPMITQVGKVLDSRGNPNPVTTLTTDDGKQHKVNPMQANVIKMLLTTDKVKPDVKRAFTKDVQNSETLGMLLQAKDQNDMVKAFLSKYGNPDSPERSNYA
jgi:hypothetical protein